MHTFNYDDVPSVKTKFGSVKGYQFDGTYIFKGIPYGDAKRFEMPTDPAPWEGVKETTSYGKVCPLLIPENPTGELLIPHMYWPTDEHCLSANIWTQHLDNQAKKPVLLWLHGGGFFAGSSIEQLAYDGANLSQYGDVVVVSINHRLNILGFLDLEPFGEKYKNSGNAGLADLVQALKWIHDNIAEFGGDPDNVTLFGQSGGGMKITALMQIAEAAPYFQRGIVMSGVAGNIMPACKGNGTAIVTAMLKELNIPVSEVDKLQTIPLPMLQMAYLKSVPALMAKGEYVGNNPLINDYFPGEPQVSHFTDKAKKTPLIIGTTYSEVGSMNPAPFNKYELTEAQMDTILTQRFKDHTPTIKEEFKKAYPHKKVVDALYLDPFFRDASKELIDAKAKYSEAPTYSYVFAYEFPCNHGRCAWHCSDIPFVFHNTDKVPVANTPGITDKLEDQISKMVVQFAYTGNPNHPGIPEWKPATDGHEVTMVFDKECYTAENLDTNLLKAYHEALPEVTFAALMAAFSKNMSQH